MKPRVYALSFRPSSSTSRPSLQVATRPHESGQSYAHTLGWLPSASIGSSIVQGTNRISENRTDEGDDAAQYQFVESITLRDRPSLSVQDPRVFLFNARGVLRGASVPRLLHLPRNCEPPAAMTGGA